MVRALDNHLLTVSAKTSNCSCITSPTATTTVRPTVKVLSLFLLLQKHTTTKYNFILSKYQFYCYFSNTNIISETTLLLLRVLLTVENNWIIQDTEVLYLSTILMFYTTTFEYYYFLLIYIAILSNSMGNIVLYTGLHLFPNYKFLSLIRSILKKTHITYNI